MAVRTVSNRGRHNTIGRFPSLKMMRMIPYESLLELDFIFLLEFSFLVTWFEAQPVVIEYVYEGEIHTYVPDFHIISDGRDWLIEVKPSALVDTEENKRKFAAARAWCEECGWYFCVVTEQKIRSGHRLANAKFLLDYGRYAIQSDIRTRIYTIVYKTARPLTVTELAQQVDPQDHHRALTAIYNMAFRHEIEISVDAAPISTTSFVSLN